MGFLDNARKLQQENDMKAKKASDALARDAQALFTDAMVDEHAKAIADGVRYALQDKIIRRFFEFKNVGLFLNKKVYYYEEGYRATVKLCDRKLYSPKYASPAESRGSRALPDFPRDDFMYIRNSGDEDHAGSDYIYCWSFDHVRKSYERAVEMLRADGMDVQFTFEPTRWAGLMLHAEVVCDENGNV